MKKGSKNSLQKAFSRLLLEWHRNSNDRAMPWKGEKDPYKIWLSEIILQQTRVEQGWAYYNSFTRHFPDIGKLAKAPDEKIMKMWEGLGYYSRCRNLIATARFITTEKKGKFPDTYEEIKSLRGVGPYTAAAIASFAYNLPHAVVDGNVFRVLSRVFGIDQPIDSTAGKKYFTALAEELLDKKEPGLYNQAIMDFGAVICKPLAPLCAACVFKKICVAYRDNTIRELPVKEKKLQIRKRWFYYLVMEYKDQIVIRQRSEKDIWQGLYEFPLIESEKEMGQAGIIQKAIQSGWLAKDKYEVISISPLIKQQLSHQLITGRFIRIKLSKKSFSGKAWQWVGGLSKYAFPKYINEYLTKKRAFQALF